MSGIRRLFCLIAVFVVCLCFTSCGSDDNLATINATLKSPCDVRVSSPYGSINVVPYAYNFSYAVNAKEWSSAVADSSHPIDMVYDKFVEVFFTKKTKLTFDFAVKPDKLIYVRRYDASLNDPEFDEEDRSLSETIERRAQYEEYEEIEIPSEMIFPYTLIVENDSAYIYEIAAIWDREDFRGTGYYSFMVRKRNRNAGK